ncbi:MAG: hypothetical protein K6U03_09630, partial [Firmicutes bacterium]|nr:hypothetical protein [Bacillota bacterium]
MKSPKLVWRLVPILVIGLMWGGLVGPLHAFELTVSPSRLDLVIEPNEVQEGAIQVGGRFDRPTRVRLRVGDWEMDQEGQLIFDQPGRNPRSLAKWLYVAPVEFVLGKDRVQTVRYRLQVPKEITGGYWGALFVETVPETPQLGGGANVGIGISARLAVLIYAETKRGAARDGRVSEVRARWADGCLYM